MNGYTLMADSYRKLLEQGKIDKKNAEKNIRIYDFLATCDDDDKCIMVDSSAFNDFIKAYIIFAVESTDLDEESKNKVIAQSRWIFDDKNAKEVLKCWK